MKRNSFFLIFTALILIMLIVSSCGKEKILESTEYIRGTEYIEVAPDTITIIDTVFNNDSVTVYMVDTLLVFDTVIQNNNVTDTIYQTNNIYDTIIQINNIYDTVVQTNNILDTVVQINNIYDTTIIVQNHYDTVSTPEYIPSAQLAYTALQAYSDPLVLDFVNTELSLTGGWVLYLSAYQSDVTIQSNTVYDIYGIIDYWAEDWSGYYPLEYFWRMTYKSGDPSDPNNWVIAEPPAGVSGHTAGMQLKTNSSNTIEVLK